MKAKVLCKFNKKQANERICILRFFHKLKILQRLTRTIASSWAWVALCEPAFKGLFVARSHSDIQGILWQRTCENKRADSKCDL